MIRAHKLCNIIGTGIERSVCVASVCIRNSVNIISIFLLFILSLITKAAYCFLHVAFVSLLLRFLLFSFGLVFSIKPSINLFDSIVLWFLCFRWTNIKICVGKWQTMSRFDWWAASSIFFLLLSISIVSCAPIFFCQIGIFCLTSNKMRT